MTHHATPWIIGYTVVPKNTQRSFEEDVFCGTGVLHVFFVELLECFAGIGNRINPESEQVHEFSRIRIRKWQFIKQEMNQCQFFLYTNYA